MGIEYSWVTTVSIVKANFAAIRMPPHEPTTWGDPAEKNDDAKGRLR
jgi:hypothetical protein